MNWMKNEVDDDTLVVWWRCNGLDALRPVSRSPWTVARPMKNDCQNPYWRRWGRTPWAVGRVVHDVLSLVFVCVCVFFFIFFMSAVGGAWRAWYVVRSAIWEMKKWHSGNILHFFTRVQIVIHVLSPIIFALTDVFYASIKIAMISF